MRVGILTHFHKSTNYGGVLQAYALCKYLNNCGYSARQILYNSQAVRFGDPSRKPGDLLKRVCLRFKREINKKKNREIRKMMESSFCEFRERVPHTEREYSKNNISEVVDEFDAFITGSDQVWNPFWYDSSYFLDFVGPEKFMISYAASLGVGKIEKSQEEIYKTSLSRFRDISVRENVAAELLAPLVERDVKISVDPTLLLSAEDWDEVVSPCIIDKNYIFLYMLGDDIEARKTAEKFAKAKGLELVMIPDLLGEFRINDRKIRGQRLSNVTPEDFISLIKYADYVITDSFHACVFSILYKKEFFAFERTGGLKMGSRINNLTELFGCPERFCMQEEKKNVKYLQSLSTAYNSPKFEEFMEKQQISMKYLNENLCVQDKAR